MRALLLTLLVALPVAAQVFLPARRITPAIIADSDPTNLLVSPRYWWNAEDLSSSPVETWTDRVQGLNMKQTTGANQPTWSSSYGVYIDGLDDYLIVTNVAAAVQPSGDATWLFVMGGAQQAGAVQRLIWGNQMSGGAVTLLTQTNWFGDANGAVGDEFGPVGTQFMSLLIGSTNSGSGDNFALTNGVLAWDPGTEWLGGDVSRLGQASGGAASQWHGYVLEIIGWTNAFFNETQLSNINKYVTSVWTQIGQSAYTALTAVFDGTNDSMRLTSSGPTGLADGKTFTFSGWVRFDGGDGAVQCLWTFATSAASTRCQIFKQADNTLRVFARNAAGGTILDKSTTTTFTASANWVHLYVCVDLANAANFKVYADGVSQAIDGGGTYTDDTIDFVNVNATYTIGGSGDAVVAALLNGAYAEFWWDDSYLDAPSSLGSSGRPLDLGYNGAVPTGSAPVFYYRGAGNTFNVNSGTGGDMTVTGSLALTTPPWP